MLFDKPDYTWLSLLYTHASSEQNITKFDHYVCEPETAIVDT